MHCQWSDVKDTKKSVELSKFRIESLCTENEPFGRTNSGFVRHVHRLLSLQEHESNLRGLRHDLIHTFTLIIALHVKPKSPMKYISFLRKSNVTDIIKLWLYPEGCNSYTFIQFKIMKDTLSFLNFNDRKSQIWNIRKQRIKYLQIVSHDDLTKCIA